MNGIGVGADPGTTHPPWEKEILGKRKPNSNILKG
jgi:hypothetical protein